MTETRLETIYLNFIGIGWARLNDLLELLRQSSVGSNPKSVLVRTSNTRAQSCR